jgi:hypothetical protein
LVQISIFLGTVDETANESHLKDSQKKKVWGQLQGSSFWG